MQEEVYAYEKYKGFKIYVTQENPSSGVAFCADIIDTSGDDNSVIHTEFSILSGEQALDKAKSYVDQFVDYD